MTKNGTKEAERIKALKDAEKQKEAVDVLASIDARVEALVQQRQQIAQQRRQLAQQLQRVETEDIAAQGAILTLEALRKELAEKKVEDD